MDADGWEAVSIKDMTIIWDWNSRCNHLWKGYAQHLCQSVDKFVNAGT